MRHLCVIFKNYADYALRAELCDFASVHNSGSPALLILVLSALSKCDVAFEFVCAVRMHRNN